jgi:hemerythrin superfamily protein
MTAGNIADKIDENAGAIEILTNQHNQIKQLFALVENSEGEQRQEEFDHLRALLAVHETAEEEVLRPVTRSKLTNGKEVAQARIDEENEAKEVLAKLEKLGTGSPEFMPQFQQFKKSVLAHAESEEIYEFPGIRSSMGADELKKMGKRIKEAERMAPTHPHPSAKSTGANYVMGPFAAMVDRVRDAMKSSSKK